jgi:hypothetical protein
VTPGPDREAERVRRERKDALLSYAARTVAQAALRRAREERLEAERQIAARDAQRRRATARTFALGSLVLLVLLAAGAAVALGGALG